MFQKRIMPLADKYILVGEKSTMERVKKQIVFESTRLDIMNIWYKKKKIDIEILNDYDEYRQYSKSKDDTNKKIIVMFCLSLESNDRKEIQYELSNVLPVNTKYLTVVETDNGEKHLREKDLNYLMERRRRNALFAEFKLLSPVAYSSYPIYGLNESSRQCLYIACALFASVILRRKSYPFKRA